MLSQDILRYITNETDWNIAEPTQDYYIKKAKVLAFESDETTRKERLAVALKRCYSLYRKTVVGETLYRKRKDASGNLEYIPVDNMVDIDTAMKVLKEIHELEGLKIIRKAETDSEGKDVTMGERLLRKKGFTERDLEEFLKDSGDTG